MFRTSRTSTVVATFAIVGLALTACGTTNNSSNTPSSGGGSSSSGGATPCDGKIAFLGPQTGDYANLGINILNGAKLAVQQFNVKNKDLKITLKEFVPGFRLPR